jgi:biopolymer transport protein ExbD
MKSLAALPLVLVGCISPVMTFGEGKSRKQAQHDTLTSFLPAPLATEGTYQGPIKDATLRVYADNAYRAQNLDWRDAFGQSVEYANQVLGPQFGLRLVVDYREWNHHAPANSLADNLEELIKLDAGDDAFSVVGLTSSLSLVSATFDQLGYATVPGRHMMLRGYADLEERKAFMAAFPDLPAEERERAHVVRRQHKAAAVLLHELAHNLGVGHETIDYTLMNAGYSEKAADFTAEARATMRRAVDQRLGRASTEAAPQVQLAAAQTKQSKMYVYISASSVLIAGKPRASGELGSVFSAQAALDANTEVVIEKDSSVPHERLREVVDRAKASGLKKVTVK